MSESNKPKIIAKTPEEFKEISDKLSKLPECVTDQIDTAENGLVGLTCNIRYKFSQQQTICLPKTTQIKDFGDKIGIYAGEYFFTLGKELRKCELEYIFVDELKKLVSDGSD